jgi:hypothetical protein
LRVAIVTAVARVVARQEKSVYKEEGTRGVRRSWMRVELRGDRCYCREGWAGHAKLVEVVAGEDESRISL